MSKIYELCKIIRKRNRKKSKRQSITYDKKLKGGGVTKIKGFHKKMRKKHIKCYKV